jgi:phosphoserine phosphatase
MRHAPVRLVCFDLNGTLIAENSWQHLNSAMGVTRKEDEDLLSSYRNGKISYHEGLQKLLPLYQRNGKFRKEIVERALYDYSYCEYAKEIIRYVSGKNYHTAIISGSFDMLVEKIAKELQVQYWAANNRFTFDKNGIGQSIECWGNDDTFKRVKLEEMCQSLHIAVTRCVCVGDSQNDRQIFKASGHGIALRGSEIEKDAWRVIEKLEDLKSIL